jgi:hypothetical protein
MPTTVMPLANTGMSNSWSSVANSMPQCGVYVESALQVQRLSCRTVGVQVKRCIKRRRVTDRFGPKAASRHLSVCCGNGLEYWIGQTDCFRLHKPE